MRAALDGNGLVLSGARLLRQQPASRIPRSARPRTPTSARASTPPPRSAACRSGTFIGRDPGRSVAENLREAERVFPPLVDYAGERGVRLMIENCVMEGWHPDGYPGNLAYSPELWEWMFELGLYLNFDPSHLLWLGHRSRRGAAALRRPGRARARQGRRDVPGRAQPLRVLRPHLDARGGPVGHGLVALPDPGPRPGRLPATTSTRSTRAASTASCRSSTRTRSGAAARRRSRPGCGSPTGTSEGWWSRDARSSRSATW